MPNRPLVVIAITLLATLTACGTAPSVPAATGRIAFSSNRDGSY